ncbi:hypothetical protein GCM10008937_22020 [Deinococcus depolymerans]|uniref:Uncharacterized protein n=1 Tax=Deinococcus depolymerans TaxID=392408 RepID=A0ABN1CA32_9DEIO
MGAHFTRQTLLVTPQQGAAGRVPRFLNGLDCDFERLTRHARSLSRRAAFTSPERTIPGAFCGFRLSGAQPASPPGGHLHARLSRSSSAGPLSESLPPGWK